MWKSLLIRNKRSDSGEEPTKKNTRLEYDDQQTLEEATQKGHYHYWLQQYDVADIARLEYRYGIEEADTLFEIGSTQQLSNQLKQFQTKVSQERETRPFTLIVNLGNVHWVTLVISYQNRQFYGYYVDSLGNRMPNDIQQTLEQAQVTHIDFHNLLPTPQQKDGHNCGLWALENATDLNKMLQETQPLDWAVTQLKRPRDEAHFREKRRYFAEKLRQDETSMLRNPRHAHVEPVLNSESSQLKKHLFNQSEQRTLNRKLFSAIEKGRLQKVKDWLAKGADIQAKDSDGSTALHLAVEKGHTEMVRLLLDQKVDFAIKNSNNETPLEIAERLNQHLITQILKVQLQSSAFVQASPLSGQPGNPGNRELDRFLSLLSSQESLEREYRKLYSEEGTIIYSDDPIVCDLFLMSASPKEENRQLNDLLGEARASYIFSEQDNCFYYISKNQAENTVKIKRLTISASNLLEALKADLGISKESLKSDEAYRSIKVLDAELLHKMTSLTRHTPRKYYHHDQGQRIYLDPKDVSLQKVKDLYLQALIDLKKVVQTGHIDRLKNLNELLGYIQGIENRTALKTFYGDSTNPLKGTDLIILACQHHQIEVLSYLFDDHTTILDHLLTIIERKAFKPSDPDNEGHTAFYYAIRSGDVNLVNTLTQWPVKHLDSPDDPQGFNTLLADAYKQLQSDQVPLAEEILAYVNSRLNLDNPNSSGVLESHKGVATPGQVSPGTAEKDTRQLEKSIDKLALDEDKTLTYNVININVVGVSGIGQTIQGNINVTGAKITKNIIPPSPAKSLPELWKVPTKNNNFVGRSELLKQIEDHFSQKDIPAVLTACSGLGGIGKTQVALEFVWRHYKKYKGVVWFNAESRDRLLNEYVKLGMDLHIIHTDENNIPIEDRAHRVKQWLEHSDRAGWLLVYDNAPNYETIKEFLPTKEGKLLVTSRYKAEWEQENIPVDVFTFEESREYIQKVLGLGNPLSESDREQIDTLAETLGRLPLALAQASAYIKKNMISISRYLKLYKQRKRDLLHSKILPSDYRDSVYITWDITMDKIKSESLLATNWLNSCACLASSDIPDFLLEKFAQDSENNPNSEIYEEARGILSSYSMLTIDEQSHSASIHLLVQEVIQLKWGVEEKEKNLVAAGQLLQNSFPYYHKTLEAYAQKRQLLPHLEAFLPHLEIWQQEVTNVSPALGQVIEERFIRFFLYNMSDGYGDLGDAAKQRDVLERVLVINEKYYGSDHPDVALTLMNLSTAYVPLGDALKSRDLLERALIIFERHYGLDHPDVARVLANQGATYGTLGQDEKARDLYERALSILEKHYGPDHPDVALTLMSLSIEYGNLGDAIKKRDLNEQALIIFEKHYGPDHPYVALTLMNLGAAYETLREAEKARSVLERALTLLEKHYSPDHPNVALTLMNLGNAYGNLGDTLKKRDLLERALLLLENHYSPDNPNVARTLMNLGNAYGKLGNIQKKHNLLEQALIIFESHYGLDHPEVARTLMNLGNVYGDLENAQKKRDVLERALAILEMHYSPDHPEVVRTLVNLGAAYGTLGQLEKSRDLLERGFPLFEKHYGPGHQEVARTLMVLGEVYGLLGDAQKACSSLERALAILERQYDPDHPEIMRILMNLGTAYGTLHQAEKAIDVHQRALPLLERHYGPDHPEVASILKKLGIAYAVLGDAQKSRKFLERTLTINKRYYGPNHPEVAKTLNVLEVARALEHAQKRGPQPSVIEQDRSPFHKAASSGNLDIVKSFIDRGADTEAVEQRGYTPLHLAVKHNHINIIRILLRHGAIFNAKAKTSNQETPLDIANQNHHEATIHLLDSVRLLFEGIQEGLNQETVNFLLDVLSRDDRLAVIGACDRDGRVLLHYAAQQGCLKLVEFLLDQKINVNIVAKDKAKWMPLHHAAKTNHLPIVSALLKHGAIYSARDHHGRTPLQLTNNPEIKELLSVTDKLFNYVRAGNLNELTGYLNQGVVIHARNNDGKTLVHVAAQNAHGEIVKRLLQREIVVDALDNDDRTSLQLAVQENHLAVALILLEQGANINVLNEHQQGLVAEYMSNQQFETDHI